MSTMEQHDLCTRRFIQLANELKDEGIDVALVSAALMSASAIYVTYATAGNAGALEVSGVDKVVNQYRETVEHIQDLKKEQIKQEVEAIRQAQQEGEED